MDGFWLAMFLSLINWKKTTIPKNEQNLLGLLQQER